MSRGYMPDGTSIYEGELPIQKSSGLFDLCSVYLQKRFILPLPVLVFLW